MKKFLVLLHGTNALLEHEGELERGGFYVHKRVIAADREAAGKLAASQAYDANSLNTELRNPQHEPPEILIDEIEEVEDFDGPIDEPLGVTYYIDTHDD